MPYKDRERQKEYLREYQRLRKEKAAKAEAFYQADCKNVALIRIDHFQRELAREGPPKREASHGKIIIKPYSTMGLQEEYKPVVERVKAVCPWVDNQRIVDDIHTDLVSTTPKERYEEALDAYAAIHHRERMKIDMEREAAHRILRKSEKYPDTWREIPQPYGIEDKTRFEERKAKRWETLRDMCHYLYDQGFSYYVTNELLRLNYVIPRDELAQINQDPFMRQWAIAERDATKHLAAVVKRDEYLSDVWLNHHLEVLRWMRARMRENWSDTRIEQALVEQYGRLKGGAYAKFAEQERKNMIRVTLELQERR